MNGRRELVINLNVSWPMLAMLAIAGVVLVLAYASVGAQGGDPPNTNNVQVEPTRDVPEPTPVTPPLASPLQGDDLVFTTNDEWVPHTVVGRASPPQIGVTGIGAQANGGHHFYLTDVNYYTDQALTACDSGYHMASLWEILDVSNLIYDYDHPAAHTKADSGYGPPSYWHGWVRTGQNSSGSTTTGTGNCLNWSTRSGDSSGVSVRLSRGWETAPGDISTWDANTFACSIPGPVWCVED
jgi:hypothetical protein